MWSSNLVNTVTVPFRAEESVTQVFIVLAEAVVDEAVI